MTIPEVRRHADLPPLSWLLALAPGRSTLHCGESVEVVPEDHGVTFYEGAWDGDAAALGFFEAANFFGSGALIRGSQARFATSTHTLDALFVLSRGSERIVSNSLAFLIRFAGLDPGTMTAMPSKVMTVLKGLRACEQVIHDDGQARIDRLTYCNFELGDDGIVRSEKSEPPRFGRFEDYDAYLVDVLSKVKANGESDRRRTRYTLLATCSSGYDSVASAALAARLGCREAITLRSARYGLEDSGAAAAASLGLSCVELDRPEVSSPEGAFLDAEFLASFCPGDCSYQVYDGLVRRRLLLTGHHGDMTWAMHREPDAPFRRHGGGSGMGLHELRLRADCIVVPVPYIGEIRQRELHGISNSEAMRPWSVGGHYDRPIPRRIAEEAGVPRASFGGRKAVASLAFWEWRFADSTLEAADRFTRARTNRAFWIAERTHRGLAALLRAGVEANRGPKPAARPASRPARFAARVRRALLKRLSRRYKPVFADRLYRDYLTLWSIEHVGMRYDVGAAPPGRSPNAGPAAIRDERNPESRIREPSDPVAGSSRNDLAYVEQSEPGVDSTPVPEKRSRGG